MKKFFTLCFSTYTFVALLAQSNSISLQYVPTLATFNYRDAAGNADPNMRSAFKSGVGVNFAHITKAGLLIRPGIEFKNTGATTTLYSDKMDWSLNYFDVNLGLGYIKSFRYIAPYIGATPYFSYLYKGNQKFGTTNYDLITLKAVKQSDWGLNFFGGMRFRISEVLSFFIEARYGLGLMQLEPSDKQKLYNRNFAFPIGISFNLLSPNKLTQRSNF